MIKEYRKGSDIQLSVHFHLRAFDCRCHDSSCVVTYVDDELIEALEIMFPACPTMWLSCGFRCTKHNRLIGGKPGSLHLTGKAADIHAHGYDGKEIAAIASIISAFNIGGIGQYATFAHCDVRGYSSRWFG